VRSTHPIKKYGGSREGLIIPRRKDEALLRQLVREVLISEAPESKDEKPPPPQTGPDVKGSPVAQAAEKRLDAFPSINSVLKNISTAKDLRALVQNILDKVGESGKITQAEMQGALSKTLAASRKAAVEKKKQEKEAADREAAAAEAQSPSETSPARSS
jgi:hypothetical protein